MHRIKFALLALGLILVSATADEPPARRTDSDGDPLPAGALFRIGSVRFRTGGGINDVAISPDGRSLATSTGAGITIFDLSTGKPVRHIASVIEPPYFSGQPIAYSPDGREVISVSWKGGARAWDTSTGRATREIAEMERDHMPGRLLTRKIVWNSIHDSPDGKELFADSFNTMFVLDAITGRVKRKFPITGHVRSVAGDLFAMVAPNPSRVYVLDSHGKERLAVEPDGQPYWAGFGPAQKTFITASASAQICVWDMATGRKLLSVQVQCPKNYQSSFVSTLAISPDEKTLFAGTATGEILRWDMKSGKELAPLIGHRGNVHVLRFLRDNKTLLSAASDNQIRKWDAGTGKLLAGPDRNTEWIYGVNSPVSDDIAVGDDSGLLELWDAKTGRRRKILQEFGTPITALCYSLDGRWLACGLSDEGVAVRNALTGELIRKVALPTSTYPRPLPYCTGLAISGHGDRLVTSFATDGTRIWDMKSGKSICAYDPDGEIAFAQNDVSLVWASARSNMLTKFDSRTGTEQWHVQPAPPGSATSLAISPVAGSFAVGQSNGQIAFFNLADGSATRTWKLGVGSMIRALSYSSGGEWLLGSIGAEIRLWEVATGAELLRLTGHTGFVHNLSFTPDGRAIVSASRDATVLIWTLRPANTGPPREEAAKLWEELASRDSSRAYRALWALLDDPPAAVRLLRDQMPSQPAAPIKPEQFRTLLAKLEAANFKDREQAQHSIEEIGTPAIPLLKQALEQETSPEIKRRAKKIIDDIQLGISPNALRRRRSVQVLEMANTPEARQLLRDWAAPQPATQLGDLAKAAWERLKRRDAMKLEK